PATVLERFLHHAPDQLLALFAPLLGGIALDKRAVVQQLDRNLAQLLAAPVERIEGARVDADTHGDASALGRLDNGGEGLAPVLEVAGIDAHTIHALLDRHEGKLTVVVNVGDQGDGDLPLDGAERLRVDL